MINYRRTIVIIVLISIVKSATSILCYQCNSSNIENQFQCNELMDSSDLEPSPCMDVYNAAYCVKLIGRIEGGVGTKRYCSSHDLGNHCDYGKQPGDQFEDRTCVFTCDSDGCNGSNQVKLFGYLSGISLFPLIRWLLF